MSGARTVAGKVAIVARVTATMRAVATLAGPLVVEITKTAATMSTTTTLAGALAVEFVKVTMSKKAIMTVVSSLHKATLAIGQIRVILSVGLAGVTVVVAKSVTNVMTRGVMMHGIM